jgi:putative transposase
LIFTRIFCETGETRGTYGSHRISAMLRSQWHDVGRYRARSLMKKVGISIKHRRKFRITTDSKHNLPVAPNLLKRNFQVDRPDTVWCSDITYLWTMEGWLYLAVVIDLYLRKVVCWGGAMSSRMKESRVTEALGYLWYDHAA